MRNQDVESMKLKNKRPRFSGYVDDLQEFVWKRLEWKHFIIERGPSC